MFPIRTAQLAALGILALPGIGLAQTAQRDSSAAVFQSQAKLVQVPFRVARGDSFVAGIQSSDVALLEDGFSRRFSVFETPAADRQLPLELALHFDTTTLLKSQRPTHWNREATYKFTAGWNDTMSRALLDQAGANAKISVYHVDQNRMERLCLPTDDPPELTKAFHRLLSPLSDSSAVKLELPPFRHALGPRDAIDFSPGWIMEASIATMKESISFPDPAKRMLVVFSAGKGGTETSPEYVSIQSRELGVPILNVLLDYTKPPIDPLMDYFEDLAESTGGHLFFRSRLNARTIGGILKIARDLRLPQYVVGFVPESAGSKQHNLEIRLKSKEKGRLIGGKRQATY